MVTNLPALIPAWISNHMLSQVWDEITYSFPNFYGCIVEVWVCTVGTPYNTNVGVQKIPDRAIWKPVVAKRNNTNPWSCSKPQILVTRDSRQVHMAEQPASLMHSLQTAWQLFNLGQSTHSPPAGPRRQLHTIVFHTFDSVSPCCKQQISRLSNRLTHAHSQSNLA